MKKTVWIAACLLLLLLAACSSNNGAGQTEATAAGGSADRTEQPSEGGSSGGSAKQTIGGASSDEPVKLTMAVYHLSDQLKAAVKAYEQLHPNVDIELQATPSYGKDLNEAMANHDRFVTGTNTAILAGRGPDLIELDALPMDAYADRGLLVNLGEMIARDPSFREEDYFTNILDNAAFGGGLYGMPLYFSMVGMIADEDAIGKAGVQIDDSSWTWDDFIQIAKQLQKQGGDKQVLIGEPSYMLGELAAQNFAQLVTEAGSAKSFDADRLVGLMEQVQEMVDSGLFLNFLNVEGGRGQIVASKIDAYFNMRSEIGSFDRYLAGDGYGEHARLYAMPHPADAGAGGYFSTFGTIGISASSPHPEAAWQFIRYLTEDAEQSSADIHGSGRGFPISKRVYDIQADKLKEAGTVATESGDEIAVDAAKLDRLESYLTEAVHWERTLSDLDDTIIEESKAFFNGQKSAQDVAKLVKSKVELILNE